MIIILGLILQIQLYVGVFIVYYFMQRNKFYPLPHCTLCNYISTIK